MSDSERWSMIWPAGQPLLEVPADMPLYDMTEDEYRSVIESRSRGYLVRRYVREIQQGVTTKKEVWERLIEAPKPYREDMVARLRKEMGGA